MISKNKHSKLFLVIGYWNLRFVCNLPARRLFGGVLVFCYLHKTQSNNN